MTKDYSPKAKPKDVKAKTAILHLTFRWNHRNGFPYGKNRDKKKKNKNGPRWYRSNQGNPCHKANEEQKDGGGIPAL